MKTCIISNINENKITDLGKLLLRVTLAVTIFPHGAQKVLGWFGGGGFSATYKGFTEGMGIWGPLAVIAILTEFLSPFFLLAGVLTRLNALALAILMSVALSVSTGNGFFMNWGGNQAGEGIEFHLLFIGAALALMLLGGGRISLDNLVYRKFCPASQTD